MLNSTEHEISAALGSCNADKFKTSCFQTVSNVVFILLINIEMPAIDILTLISMINSMLS